ncbi:hypothetical protein J6590_035654 [Homalodisca vitripennis]|nr:hypothetical protein J6590_035654 [Homalodisca vitripennis]
MEESKQEYYELRNEILAFSIVAGLPPLSQVNCKLQPNRGWSRAPGSKVTRRVDPKGLRHYSPEARRFAQHKISVTLSGGEIGIGTGSDQPGALLYLRSALGHYLGLTLSKLSILNLILRFLFRHRIADDDFRHKSQWEACTWGLQTEHTLLLAPGRSEAKETNPPAGGACGGLRGTRHSGGVGCGEAARQSSEPRPVEAPVSGSFSVMCRMDFHNSIQTSLPLALTGQLKH